MNSLIQKLKQGSDINENEREKAVSLLADVLNNSQKNSHFTFSDNSDAINLNIKGDPLTYEIHVWLDSRVELTLYTEEDGLFDVCGSRSFAEVIENPSIILSDLKYLKQRYAEEYDLDDDIWFE